MRGKGGPSSYRADNQATKPRKGARGPLAEQFNPGESMPRKHEVKAPSPRRKRGFGKIVASGKPRFTRHSQF